MDVDLPNQTVTATYTGGGIPLWFASIFGIEHHGRSMRWPRRMSETSKAACVMPVAIPDMWNNVNIAVPSGTTTPRMLGHRTASGDFNDKNHNGSGTGAEGEREHWEFDVRRTIYDQATIRLRDDLPEQSEVPQRDLTRPTTTAVRSR